MINIELLKKNIEDGYIIKQTHNKLDLTIYNYSQATQYENKWDEVTLMCRGLILDSEFNIIERPFGKFFNISEHVSEFKPDIPNLPFEVYDKLDGSLGILYWDGDKPYIASRGSFNSEQALAGTEILYENYVDSFKNLDKSKTYVFEIIYSSNRIVVDYGNTCDLFLLGVIDKQTGEDLPLSNYQNIGFKTVERIDGIKDFDKLKSLELENKEGFVIKYSNGFRMKLKFDEYCRLHRIVTNISSYDIWDCLRNGTDFSEMLDKVPDEFYDWVKKIKSELETSFNNEKNKWLDIYEYGKSIENQKDFALWASDWKEPGVLFALRNGKKIDNILWKKLKPKFEKPFSSK